METSKDSVTIWLNSAGSVPLLAKQETYRLATIIQSNSASQGRKDRAISKLVKHNLRLVPAVVRKCMSSKRSLWYGGPGTDDLLQVGAMGLHRAAERFDPTLGYAFSTYAALWIYQAIQRDLYNNISAIRIPESCRRELYKYIDEHKEVTFCHLDSSKRTRMLDAFAALSCASLDSDLRNGKSDDSSDFDQEASLSGSVSKGLNGAPLSNLPSDSFEDILGLADLNEYQQRLLVLIYRDGLTIVKAAKIIDITVDKAKALIKSGLNALRLSLS